MASFGEVEGVWVERLGGLRNAVRQHLIAEQLAAHLDGLGTGLDVGCGQGTRAIHLEGRRSGCTWSRGADE